jgi:hypothetical protein
MYQQAEYADMSHLSQWTASSIILIRWSKVTGYLVYIYFTGEW